jgi:hypothetical protein
MCGGGGRGVIEFSDAFGPLYARDGCLEKQDCPLPDSPPVGWVGLSAQPDRLTVNTEHLPSLRADLLGLAAGCASVRVSATCLEA